MITKINWIRAAVLLRLKIIPILLFPSVPSWPASLCIYRLSVARSSIVIVQSRLSCISYFAHHCCRVSMASCVASVFAGCLGKTLASYVKPIPFDSLSSWTCPSHLAYRSLESAKKLCISIRKKDIVRRYRKFANHGRLEYARCITGFTTDEPYIYYVPGFSKRLKNMFTI